MDGSTPLSLDRVAADSPVQRAGITRFDLELDNFVRWSESYLAILKHFTKEAIKANEAQVAIVNQLPEVQLYREKGLFQVAGNQMVTIYHAKAKLVDEVIEATIEPLEAFQKEAKDMKSITKTYATLAERYDTALVKYSSLSKTKEASLLIEEALILSEFRKLYIRAAFEVTQRILVFRDKIHHIVAECMLAYIMAHSEFYKAASEVHEGLSTITAELRLTANEDLEYKAKGIAVLEAKRKTLEEIALSKARPANTSAADLPTLADKNPRFLASPSVSIANTDGVFEKEGWLFKKLPGRGWNRRYFKVEKGGFSFQTISAKHPGTVLSTPCVNILLCNMRAVKNDERRFCFEISTVYNKTVLLQAESEEEVRSWISIFEAAKGHALIDPPTSILVSDFSIGDGHHDEEEDGIPLHRLLHDSPRKVSISGLDNDDEDEEDEGMMSDTAVAGEEEFQYPDPLIKKENVKLHRLVRQVPRSDCVMDVFSCAWQKDIAVHGKLFLTYDRICFYSNILGFVKMLVLNLKQVTNVALRRGPLYSSIVVTNFEGTHTFKTFLKDDTRFNTLKTAWKNASAEARMSRQELFELAHRRKVRPRASTTTDSTAVEGTLPREGEGSSSVPGDAADVSAVNEKYKLPADIPEPTAEVPCGCGADHLEVTVEAVLDVPAKRLYDILFEDGTTFWTQRYHPTRNETNRTETPWVDQKRDVRYVMPVNNPMVKVKEAEVHLSQALVKSSPYLVYVVESRSETPTLPYGDAFNPKTRFCITWVSKTSCKLTMTYGIEWFKSPMVKSMIRKAAMTGMAESSADAVTCLKKLINEEQSVGGGGSSSASPSKDESSTMASTGTGGVSHGKAASRASSGGDNWLAISTTSSILMALLLCSLLLHGVSWWRSPSSNAIAPARQTAAWTDTLELTDAERKDFRGFLSSHYVALPSDGARPFHNISSWTPSMPTLVSKEGTARTAYRHTQHEALYTRLAGLQGEVHGMRERTIGILAQSVTAERELVEAMFLNWMADRL
ncbi:SNF1-interacting protein [Thoreauomyces humboldtii]|nr:SNF1-interacting protein [Thoreauomyces humboldtii]